MADATIYGTIDAAYTSAKTATTKTTSIGATNNGNCAIGFKGSEDMGGGLKVSFQQEIGLNTDQNGGPNSSDSTGNSYENRNSFIGLSGGFGDVKIGKMYNFAFNNSIANDPLGFSGTSGYAGLGFGGGAASTSNMIAYTLPSIASGVGIQVGKAMGEAATTAAAPTKTGDSTSYGVTYAAGALYAGITGETITATATTKTKNSTTTITYDLGMVKVGITSTKTTLGTTYAKGSMTSISAPIGAATVWYSSGDLKSVATAGATESKTKGSQYGVNYSLSKMTYAYLQTGKTSTSATSSTSGYAIGLIKNF
jgi:predicted porin